MKNVIFMMGKLKILILGLCLIICSVSAAYAAPTVYIAGDSTAQDYGLNMYPQAGWGTYFKQQFDGIKVDNHSVQGQGLLSYEEKGLQYILDNINKGDYVLIQFGINDSFEPSTYLKLEDFKDMLINTYIKKIKDAGGIPVLLTPTPAFIYHHSNLQFYEHRDYSTPIREAAEETGCYIVDADKILTDLYNSDGITVKDVEAKYLMCEPLEAAKNAAGLDEVNHFKTAGAKLAAKTIANSLADVIPEIAQYIKKDLIFNDIKGHWAENYINKEANKGFIDGVGGNKFEPDRAITRGEFLKLIMDASSIPGHNYRAGECLDAKKEDFYSYYLQGALDRSLIPNEMITDCTVTNVTKKLSSKLSVDVPVYTGAFNADKPITREEAAAISARVIEAFKEKYDTEVGMSKTDKDIEKFSDSGKISSWAYGDVSKSIAYGIFEGVTNTEFDPKNSITRAQAAKIISVMPGLSL